MKNQIRNSKGQTEEEFLKEYDPSKYKKPSVTVDILIFRLGEKSSNDIGRDVEMLLIKRGNFPELGKWACPGGFIEMDESLEESAKRELYEETGVKDVYLQQLKTFGDPKRDKRDRVITVAYMSIIDEQLEVKAGDDAADAKWYKVNLKKGNRIKKEDGYDEKWIISLLNKDINLECILIKKVRKIGVLKSKDFQIIDGGLIASDHSKLIAFGIEKLEHILG